MNNDNRIKKDMTQLSYRKNHDNKVYPKTFSTHIFLNTKGRSLSSVGGIQIGDNLEDYETLDALLEDMFFKQSLERGLFWEKCDIILTEEEINF